MPDTLESKIKNWLKSQGYPLEMEAASIASKIGFDVSLSDYFIDPEDEKPREIDLIISRKEFRYNSYSLSYSLCVECKSGKDKPWLLLATENYLNVREHEKLPIGLNYLLHSSYRATKLAENVLFKSSINGEIKSIFPRLDMAPKLGYAVVQAFNQGNDIPYKALMSASKAAADYVKRFGRSGFSIPVHIAIPIVLIDAPLYSVVRKLDGEMEVDSIEYAPVLWNTVVAGRSRNGIYVVQKEHLHNFLVECNNSANWWLNLPEDKLNVIHQELTERNSGLS